MFGGNRDAWVRCHHEVSRQTPLLRPLLPPPAAWTTIAGFSVGAHQTRRLMADVSLGGVEHRRQRAASAHDCHRRLRHGKPSKCPEGFERVGAAAEISGDPVQLAKADKIVLPGVGAFRDAMAELHRCQLIEPLLEAIRSDKPFLGICLGLQLLFDVSYEGEECRGLGVIPGKSCDSTCPAASRFRTWVGIRPSFVGRPTSRGHPGR